MISHSTGLRPLQPGEASKVKRRREAGASSPFDWTHASTLLANYSQWSEKVEKHDCDSEMSLQQQLALSMQQKVSNR